jgi:uncharacterized membrane protein YraQ (UPF0718 family)/copper chaperone CopZ
MGVVLTDMAPWLLFGLFVAGVLHVTCPMSFVRRHLGGRGFWNVFKAVLVGVPLPLCSCGVIPASIGLKRDGASDGASVGFLISTPQTGVDSILVSARFLGWPFALFKVLSALVTGLVGGQMVNWFGRATVDVSAADRTEQPISGLRRRVAEMVRFGFVQLLGDIYLWLILGIIISGLISALVPPDFFAGMPWMQGLPGMLVMLAISAPMYVCATSSAPIAASLIHAGMPTGAALVFLMAGPATNAATVGAIFRAFGRRVGLIYIGTVAVSSVLLGWLFEGVLGGASAQSAAMCHAVSRPAGLAASVVLALLLAGHAAAHLRRRLGAARSAERPAAGGEVRLAVSGMTCRHCAGNVRRALESVGGVKSVVVDLGSGTAIVRGEGVPSARLVEALADAGYPAEAAR